MTRMKVDIGAPAFVLLIRYARLDVLAICQPDRQISQCRLTGVHLGPTNLSVSHVVQCGIWWNVPRYQIGHSSIATRHSNVAQIRRSSLQSLRNRSFVGVFGHVGYQVRHRASVYSASVSRRIGAKQYSCRGDGHI